MFNPHTKFEVSKITFNKEMKGNDKCKNSRFEPPFGGLRGNAKRFIYGSMESALWTLIKLCQTQSETVTV